MCHLMRSQLAVGSNKDSIYVFFSSCYRVSRQGLKTSFFLSSLVLEQIQETFVKIFLFGPCCSCNLNQFLFIIMYILQVACLIFLWIWFLLKGIYNFMLDLWLEIAPALFSWWCFHFCIWIMLNIIILRIAFMRNYKCSCLGMLRSKLF